MKPSSPIDLKDYRQPVVTSLGVIIGFLLGFLGQWVTEENFALRGLGDYVTFFGTLLGVCLLFLALFRMLSPNTQPENALNVYRGVLKLYVLGVVIPFSSLVLSAFI